MPTIELVKKTGLNLFNRQVNSSSIITVQVFDQKKFKKKDQGFLGVINVQMSSIFDLAVGGDGNEQNLTSKLFKLKALTF
jgi:hypothetical protein